MKKLLSILTMFSFLGFNTTNLISCENSTSKNIEENINNLKLTDQSFR